jgi:hypothetical protein
MTGLRGACLALLALIPVPSAVPAETPNTSVNLSVADLRFYQDKEGLTVANAWGDPATGPHSNYIRLDGHSRSPAHIHTSSYYGVVISGVVANVAPGARDRPLPPGSYWYQKGMEPHVTSCLSQTPCLIFVTSAGPFDLIVVPETPHS